MKKSILAAGALFAALATSAQADVVTTLHLEFASGAVFDGTVTFADNYAKVLDTSGTLSGGGYSPTHFGWTWWHGTNQTNPNDWDGDPSTYEDILMTGDIVGQWTSFIGFSWIHGNPGDAPVLTLGSPQSYWRSHSSGDAVVAGHFGSVPEPASLALAGLALVAAAATRRAKKAPAA